MAEPGGTKLASLIAEIDLDRTKYDKAIDDAISGAEVATVKVETSWRKLGAKTDEIYEKQRLSVEKYYKSIVDKGQLTANEIVAIEQAKAARIAAIDSRQYAARNALIAQEEKNWSTLGLRSVAAIEAQKASVVASYENIRKSGTASAQDLINIENAKNTKLKELNRELVDDHSKGWREMTNDIFRFAGAIYIASAALGGIKAFLMSGVKAIDDLKLSTIAVAAQITTMQGTSGNVTENYKNNVIYAEALNKKLQEIDANSFANLSQIQKMNMAMTNQGVLLDINNAKQVESFTALTNAVALFTQGQDKEKQASQEIRALMTGQVKAGDMVAMQMDALIKKQGDYKDGLKGLVAEGKKHGDTLERMQPYLVGIVAASGDISKTWEAVGSSIETAWKILQREIFSDFYKALVSGGQDAAAWIKQNAAEVAQYIKAGMNVVGDVIQGIWNVLKGFAPLARDFGSAASIVAYGWGGILAVLKPIGEFLGNSISLAYELTKMLGNAALAIGALATGQTDISKTAWEEAKKNYSEVEKLSIANRKILVDGIGEAVLAYDKQFHAAKKATKEAIELPVVSPGKDTSTAALQKTSSDQKEILAAMKKEHKAYYDEQIENATHAAKMSRWAAQDELQTITTLYNAKEKALNDYLKVQYADAAKEVALEKAKIDQENANARIRAEKSTTGKVAVEKGFDAEAVLIEKQKAIYAAYQKDTTKLQNERIEKLGDAGKKYISIEAEVQRTIGQYSQESHDAQMVMWKNETKEFLRYGATREQVDAMIAQKELEWAQAKLSAEASFYSSILGYEDEYRSKKLEWIALEEKRLARLYKDDVAAAKWAAEEKGRLEYELFKRKTDYISQGFGDLSSAFDGISKMYAEGSEDAKAWQAASEAMLIAQKAVAVVQAVGAIATQGLGDPYTAFVRIAAMAAAMGALLATIGESVGGASGAASTPEYSFSSSVLGTAAGTQSESVINSYKIMQDTYDMEDSKLTKIYNELKDLNSNITGLVTSIIRTGATGNFSVDLQSSEGSLVNLINQNVDFISKMSRALGGDWLGNLGILGKLDLVGNLVDGVNRLFGKVASKIFGGETTQSVGDSGIQISAPSVRALLAGYDASVSKWAYIVTHTEGGWFSSDTDTGQYAFQGVSSEVSKLFTKVFKGLSGTLYDLAVELGADTDRVLNYTFGTQMISLIGKSSDEINKEITSLISTMGDTAVSELFGSIVAPYQEINEGLMETAVRLITDKAEIMNMLDLTRQSFSGTTQAAIAFSETLIDIAGSLEDLTDAFNTYYENFFSDTEKQIDLQKKLTDALSIYGYALPDSRAGYRALIEALDLTSAAGQVAYVSLLQLSDAANTYYKYLEDAASAIKESDYATRADYLRAVAGYAEGGISSGPDSGYYAKLHGTELIVSPKGKYSATVVGADSPELLAEVKALRAAVEAGNFAIADNTAKTAKVVTIWEKIGPPATRTP